LKEFCYVLSTTKKESQTQSVLALSQVPQASSHPPKALPDLPSGLEAVTQWRNPKFEIGNGELEAMPASFGFRVGFEFTEESRLTLRFNRGHLASFWRVVHNQQRILTAQPQEAGSRQSRQGWMLWPFPMNRWTMCFNLAAVCGRTK
jgi:hypothetical protein